MLTRILSENTASISELKSNPSETVAAGGGEPVAILNRNKPAFYCVPSDLYEAMIERLDDLALKELVLARAGEPEVAVTLDEL